MVWVFLHSSHNISVINCCCFPWSSCSISVAQYSSSFFLFQDIPSCCTSYPQCLCNDSHDFPSFLSFSKACIYPIDSVLVYILVYLFSHKGSLHRQNPRLKSRRGIRTIYCLTNQSNRTHLGNKKRLSVTFHILLLT